MPFGKENTIIKNKGEGLVYQHIHCIIINNDNKNWNQPKYIAFYLSFLKYYYRKFHVFFYQHKNFNFENLLKEVKHSPKYIHTQLHFIYSAH